MSPSLLDLKGGELVGYHNRAAATSVAKLTTNFFLVNVAQHAANLRRATWFLPGRYAGLNSSIFAAEYQNGVQPITQATAFFHHPMDAPRRLAATSYRPHSIPVPQLQER